MKNLIVVVIIILGLGINLYSQQVSFSQIPSNSQFFTRGIDDSCSIQISGTIQTTGYSNFIVRINKNGVLWKTVSQPLSYSGGSANFSLAPKIVSDLSRYKFQIYFDAGLYTERDNIVCGDAYIISGQSNGIADVNGYNDSITYRSPYLITYYMNNWYNSSSSTLWGIGGWAYTLAESLIVHTQTPVCILNGAVGGTVISQHIPGGNYYNELKSRVDGAKLNGKFKAAFWYQGETEPESQIDQYASRFNTLYNTYKTEFGFQKMYVFQVRPAGCLYALQILDIQRRFADTYSDVQVLSTAWVYGHKEFDYCHYLFTGYKIIGGWVSKILRNEFYAGNFQNVNSPKIQTAYYNNNDTTITLTFDQPMIFPNDTTWTSGTTTRNVSLKNYFYLDQTHSQVSSASAAGNSIILKLFAPTNATTISYLCKTNYYIGFSGQSAIYEYPWLKNTNGYGAILFENFPIQTQIGEPINLNLKIFLQAPFNSDSMNTTLNNLGNLPLSQPYNSAPWNYSGTESVSSMYPDIVDWVLIEIRGGTTGNSQIGRRAGLLKRNGVVVDLDGNSLLHFPSINTGNYYVVVHHRNHLPIMSKNLVPLGPNSILYDFTNSIDKAYGTNSMVLLSPGKYGAFAGDDDSNNSVNVLDYGIVANNLLLTGYRSGDTNMDGTINVLDYGLIASNIFRHSNVPQ